MLPDAFIHNLFLLFPFLHHLLQAMPKRQIALKNYNLLPRLKNINYYCCPVKLFKQDKLGLTLLTRYQPFGLSLFCKKIYNHEER